MRYIIVCWPILISLFFSHEKGLLMELGVSEISAHFILCGAATLVIFLMLRKDK